MGELISPVNFLQNLKFLQVLRERPQPSPEGRVQSIGEPALMNAVYCLQCRALLAPDITVCPHCRYDQRSGPPQPVAAPQTPDPQPRATKTGTAPRKFWTPGKIIGAGCTGFFLLFVVAPCAVVNYITTAALEETRRREAADAAPITSAPAPQSAPAARVATPEPFTAPAPPQMPQESADPWKSAVGHIYAGTEVYFRMGPGDTPEPWFTVLDPFIEGNDGKPLMLVRYPSGRTEYLDRRATMRSPAAMAGQLVIRR